jgi:DNA polymerase II small subunit
VDNVEMSEREKLQRAVEATITAGYQLDSEAFEFLSTFACNDDPAVIVNMALHRIEELDEKPMFIGKSFLETILRPPERPIETQLQPQPPQNKPAELLELPKISSKRAVHPYAKDVESRLKIIDDPTGNLTSNGTIEEYLHYFQDRFKRMERLLRQRIDVKAATSISEAKKSPPRAKLKIICMISEKRESKRNIILTVEDLESTATVLVARNAREDVHKKAQRLISDQVVCIAVVKTRNDLFLAEDLIYPEMGNAPQHRAPEPVYAVLTSDMHVGSMKFHREAFDRFLAWLNGNYGNDKVKEIAGHVKYLLIAGDIVDGVGVYPNQIKELVLKDVHKQYELAAKLLDRVPDHIEIVVTPGNHDTPRKALPQPAIGGDFLKNLKESGRVRSLGDPALVSLHGVEVLMYHGRSLDDIIATVPGMAHDHPEDAMKLLLQGRHLSPLYGSKTMLAPEKRDFLVIERVPDIFHAGHIHVLGRCNYRGVLIINSGGWQEQTEYMEKLGLVPTPGKVPVVNLQTLETSVFSFL